MIVRCMYEERYQVCRSLNDPSNAFRIHSYIQRQSEASCSIINIYLGIHTPVEVLSYRGDAHLVGASRAVTKNEHSSSCKTRGDRSVLGESPVSKFTVRSRRYEK